MLAGDEICWGKVKNDIKVSSLLSRVDETPFIEVYEGGGTLLGRKISFKYFE